MRNHQYSACLLAAALLLILPIGARAQTPAPIVQGAIATVTALDLTVPSITVQAADGGISSLKVKNVRNVAGVKVGDKIQISYNRALVISVK